MRWRGFRLSSSREAKSRGAVKSKAKPHRSLPWRSSYSSVSSNSNRRQPLLPSLSVEDWASDHGKIVTTPKLLITWTKPRSRGRTPNGLLSRLSQPPLTAPILGGSSPAAVLKWNPAFRLPLQPLRSNGFYGAARRCPEASCRNSFALDRCIARLCWSYERP